MTETTGKEFVGGFAASIRAEGDLTVREAGALAIVAGGNALLKEGGAGFCVVGGDLQMAEAGAGNMLIGGNADLSDVGVGQMAAMEAHVSDSRIGVLIGGKVTMERSEVMLTTPQAIGLGAAVGAVFFLLSKLFGRS